ncbi:hypothetical protein 162322352 [Organic Lake phycodnavirus 1]|nr:hypothetical protein 162322352 [Organic Lake phycodnavirus 1]
MTELVVATMLLGGAYLVSNKKKENFEEIDVNLKKSIVNNSSKSTLAPKSEPLTTSVQKFFPSEENSPNSNFTHNNMTPFFKKKSYGNNLFNSDNRLDTYTGSGSNTIVKKETATLFKPQDNVQNVFGNPNENDFLQSRVIESKRHANTKPWKEIREGPGDLGFNSGAQYRDQTRPKTVDQLRVANNPKSEYNNNYQAPAYKPSQSGQIGKTIKKNPDTYHVNDGVGGMGPARGMDKQGEKPLQMLTHEHRENTSVSYYGARGASSNTTYTKGNNEESKKIQLPGNPFTNMSSQSVFHVSDHGKNGINVLENNRSTKQDYFGAIKGQLYANTVEPIVNQWRPTKKPIEHPNPVGFMGNTQKKHMVSNEYAPTTNREMMSETKPHMNVQGHNSHSYIQTNPYSSKSQRHTTSHSVLGNAGGISAKTSYDATYNQRNIQKPYENRIATGNMSLYNGNINASINGREQSNIRGNALYAPSNDTPHILGETTKQTQKYESPQGIDNSILKAFKENPYTHSLSSVA